MNPYFRVAVLFVASLGNAQPASQIKSAAPTIAPAGPAGKPLQISSVFDEQLGHLEKEFVSAAEAMPADKFDFVPSVNGGEFQNVRSFAQQVRHVAATNLVLCAWIEDEPLPITEEEMFNGPANVNTREQTLRFLNHSFAEAHRTLANLKTESMLDIVQRDKRKRNKLALAITILRHGFDHYGQMVVYLRMNGIVPPASRGQQ